MSVPKNDTKTNLKNKSNAPPLANHESLNIQELNLNHAFTSSSNSNEIDFNRLKNNADQSNAEAQYLTGLCDERGEKLQYSPEQAFHYFKVAADQGHALAQYNVACAYQSGCGVKQSFEKAIKYFELISEKESIYDEAKKSIDFLKASLETLRNLEIKANDGDPASQLQMGKAYFYGEFGLEKDNKMAFHFVRLAAEQRFGPAQFTLGRFFQLGRGCLRSFEKAMNYYRLAAQQGIVKANYYIGYLYANGFGIR